MNQPDDSSNAGKPDKKFVPLEAITRVEKENGRWVVYLNVPILGAGPWRDPVANNWKRINDYSTRSQKPTVAATWFERSANRTIGPPTGL